MFSRSYVRNVLSKIKNGAIQEDSLKSLVEEKLPPNTSWQDFSVLWDIVVIDETVEVILIPTDEKFLFETCAQKMFSVIHDAKCQWSPEQKFVIDSLELDWLEPLMTWENYGKVWECGFNDKTKRIESRLINIPLGQREIKEEELIPVQQEQYFKSEIPETVIDLSTASPLTEEMIKSLQDKGYIT